MAKLFPVIFYFILAQVLAQESLALTIPFKEGATVKVDLNEDGLAEQISIPDTRYSTAWILSIWSHDSKTRLYEQDISDTNVIPPARVEKIGKGVKPVVVFTLNRGGVGREFLILMESEGGFFTADEDSGHPKDQVSLAIKDADGDGYKDLVYENSGSGFNILDELYLWDNAKRKFTRNMKVRAYWEPQIKECLKRFKDESAGPRRRIYYLKRLGAMYMYVGTEKEKAGFLQLAEKIMKPVLENKKNDHLAERARKRLEVIKERFKAPVDERDMEN